MPEQTDADRLIAAITAAGEEVDLDDAFDNTFDGSPDDLEVSSRTVRNARWYRRVATVYRCPDGTYAAVEKNHGENAGDPCIEAYVVEPYEVTVTRYRRPAAPSTPEGDQAL